MYTITNISILYIHTIFTRHSPFLCIFLLLLLQTLLLLLLLSHWFNLWSVGIRLLTWNIIQIKNVDTTSHAYIFFYIQTGCVCVSVSMCRNWWESCDVRPFHLIGAAQCQTTKKLPLCSNRLPYCWWITYLIIIIKKKRYPLLIIWR